MRISPQCHLLCVIGGKGGIGKSVVAANLASALMLETRSPVLLIDGDNRSCGDQSVLLGLKPIKTIPEVALFQGALVPQSIPQLVTTHSSGLGYIGAVRGPEEILRPNVELFIKHLEFLSRTYKYIVVDLGSDFQPLQLALLAEATAFLIVTTPEILVINQTHRLMHELLTLTFPQDIFQLAINKFSTQGLSPQVIGQSLKLQPGIFLPMDEVTVAASIQRSAPFVLTHPNIPLTAAYHDWARRLSGGILQKLKASHQSHQAQQGGRRPGMSSPGESHQSGGAGSGGGGGTGGIPGQGPGGGSSGGSGGGGTGVSISPGSGEETDFRILLKLKIHNELIKAMDLKKAITDTQGDTTKEKKLRDETLKTITQLIDRESVNLGRDERSRVIKEVFDEALGLGPLEDLLADPLVTEIMVNGSKRIYIEKAGKLQISPVIFSSNQHLLNVIERIVTPIGRRVDTKTPYVDARLKDGSRVNAIIEPLALDGHSVTIRKFKKGGISPEKYIDFGSLDRRMLTFLKIAVENGLNVVVSGGTGSGKTSLLNMLSSYIPVNERIITIEDAAELQLQQDHVVRLESRPPSMEGSGAVTIRDLIRNALRMRPDRILVGECRDGAALDMLQAMNTGHDGSMTTTHANTPRECITRLETLAMMAGMDLPVRFIREQISSAIQLIVQISRMSDGSRKVISLTEVQGMQSETVTLQEIYRFKQTGYDKNRRIIGKFQSLSVPKFVEKLKERGVGVPLEIFSNSDMDPSSAESA